MDSYILLYIHHITTPTCNLLSMKTMNSTSLYKHSKEVRFKWIFESFHVIIKKWCFSGFEVLLCHDLWWLTFLSHQLGLCFWVSAFFISNVNKQIHEADWTIFSWRHLNFELYVYALHWEKFQKSGNSQRQSIVGCL